MSDLLQRLANVATTGAWSEVGALRRASVGRDGRQRLWNDRGNRDCSDRLDECGRDKDVVDQLFATLIDSRVVFARRHQRCKVPEPAGDRLDQAGRSQRYESRSPGGRAAAESSRLVQRRLGHRSGSALAFRRRHQAPLRPMLAAWQPRPPAGIARTQQIACARLRRGVETVHPETSATST
jgi:hypothetical protein